MRRKCTHMSLGMGIILLAVTFTWALAADSQEGGIGVVPGDTPECRYDVPGPRLPDEQIRELESEIGAGLSRCDYISVGMVYEANTIFVGSYGDQADPNAVISFRGANPVTSTVCLALLEQGVIGSLDDDIRLYSAKYADCLPAQYADAELTFRHLLEHSSGLPAERPGNPYPVWVNGALNLQTRPGSVFVESDVGYAVLEDVLSDMTGKTYDLLLAEIIAAPICSCSFAALRPDDPNVAGVTCTVADLTKFLACFLNAGYVSGELIRTEAWQEPLKDGKGMGWEILKAPDSDFASLAFAFSSQSNHEVWMVCQPCGQIGTVLVIQTRPGQSVDNPPQMMFDLFSIAAYRHSQDKGGPHEPQWDIP